MASFNTKTKDYYSEAEAAAFLDISISRLHMLLDENIFNNGMKRPSNLTLQASDLVLLGFWNKCRKNTKVLRMPRRGT